MEQRRTLYDDLGIPANASPGRIKAAYEAKLAELGKEDGPLAKRERDSLTRAFQTLSDPDRRDQYNTLMGLPAYLPVTAAAAAKSGAPIPLWLIAGGFVLLGLCALPFVWKPKSDAPTIIEAPPPAAAAAVADPTAPEIRPVETAKSPEEQRRYEENMRREFEHARRSFESQKQRDEYVAQQNLRAEQYKAENEKRKAEYEEQRERFRREQERRDLEMRQRAEVEKAKRQLQELQR